MRYGVNTSLKMTEAIDKAVDFFGPDGVGLEVISRNPCCVRLEGSGGHVAVTASEDEEHNVSLDIETREWDHFVKQFMKKVS